MDHELWLKLRKKGISGTDVSAILGDNPYKTALDVWKDKLGLNPSRNTFMPDSTERMTMGHELEGIVARQYAKSIGKWLVPGHFTTLHDWMRGTPDFTFYDEPIGLEIKTTGSDSVRKNLENGIFEPMWVWQSRWYMAILDYDEWHICALSNGQKKFSTIIQRDMNIELDMIKKCSKFWHENVLKAIPPER